MRSLVYLATALTVMGLAFWAYKESYRTQDKLAHMAQLQSEIAGLREGLSVLKAEWAYLNRPERLQELSDLNFERMALLPMAPEQFGTVSQVAFPAVERALSDLNLTDVMGTDAAPATAPVASGVLPVAQMKQVSAPLVEDESVQATVDEAESSDGSAASADAVSAAVAQAVAETPKTETETPSKPAPSKLAMKSSPRPSARPSRSGGAQ